MNIQYLSQEKWEQYCGTPCMMEQGESKRKRKKNVCHLTKETKGDSERGEDGTGGV